MWRAGPLLDFAFAVPPLQNRVHNPLTFWVYKSQHSCFKSQRSSFAKRISNMQRHQPQSFHGYISWFEPSKNRKTHWSQKLLSCTEHKLKWFLQPKKTVIKCWVNKLLQNFGLFLAKQWGKKTINPKRTTHTAQENILLCTKGQKNVKTRPGGLDTTGSDKQYEYSVSRPSKQDTSFEWRIACVVHIEASQFSSGAFV